MWIPDHHQPQGPVRAPAHHRSGQAWVVQHQDQEGGAVRGKTKHRGNCSITGWKMKVKRSNTITKKREKAWLWKPACNNSRSLIWSWSSLLIQTDMVQGGGDNFYYVKIREPGYESPLAIQPLSTSPENQIFGLSNKYSSRSSPSRRRGATSH